VPEKWDKILEKKFFLIFGFIILLGFPKATSALAFSSLQQVCVDKRETAPVSIFAEKLYGAYS
jgi:hypothetical protein